MPAETTPRTGTAGLVAAALIALPVGIFVGVVTTFTHRQWPLPLALPGAGGERGLPLGLLLGILVVAAVLSGLRLALGSRLAAGAAALGILGAVAVSALPGAGGSVLVADDAVGWIWGITPTLVAVVVLAWPRVIRRRGASESLAPSE